MKFTIRDLQASLLAASRLAAWMLVGAFVGYCAAPLLVSAYEGYDHGHDTEEYALFTIPAGAIAGIVIHLWLSIAKPKYFPPKP